MILFCVPRFRDCSFSSLSSLLSLSLDCRFLSFPLALHLAHCTRAAAQLRCLQTERGAGGRRSLLICLPPDSLSPLLSFPSFPAALCSAAGCPPLRTTSSRRCSSPTARTTCSSSTTISPRPRRSVLSCPVPLCRAPQQRRSRDTGRRCAQGRGVDRGCAAERRRAEEEDEGVKTGDAIHSAFASSLPRFLGRRLRRCLRSHHHSGCQCARIYAAAGAGEGDTGGNESKNEGESGLIASAANAFRTLLGAGSVRGRGDAKEER